VPVRVSFYVKGEKWGGYIPILAFGKFPIFGYPGGTCVCNYVVSEAVFCTMDRGACSRA